LTSLQERVYHYSNISPNISFDILGYYHEEVFMKKTAGVLLFVLLGAFVFAGGGQSGTQGSGGSAAGTGGATNSNPLSDIRVRQAIAHAIDRDTICKTLLQGKANPANSLTPDGEWKGTGLTDYPYNPEKARQLLKEAKWDPNYVLNGWYYYEDQQTVDMMTAVQVYLEAAGIKANFRRVSGDFNTILWKAPADMANGPSVVEWDLLYGAIAAQTVQEYYNRFAAPNAYAPTDLKLNALISGTNDSSDAAIQKAAFQDLQRYETETVLTAPLYYQPLFIFCRDNVDRAGDSNGNAQFNYAWDIINWTVKPDASGRQILKTNSGPEQFFEYVWAQPGIYIGNKVLFDRLILADGDLKPKEGGLASSWDVPPDGMSITFTLRDNIKWHDGSPITIQDIKWSLEFAIKVPVKNAVIANTLDSIEGAREWKEGSARSVSGISANGNKITIKFSRLDPNMFVSFGQFAPLPEKYFQGVDPNQFQQAPYWQKPIGSGPFKVKDVKMNDYVIFEPFTDYYRGRAKIDEIRAYPSRENDGNLIVNANSNNIDYGYTKNSADAIALEKIPGMKVFPVNMLYTRLIYFNRFPKK
jgi:peptide/nickel transport system substrate-binding protein